MFPYRRITLEFVKEIILLENTIRNFFILITAIYTFYKLLNIKPKSINMQILFLPLCLLLSSCSSLIFHNIKSLNWLCLLISFFLMVGYIEKLNLFITYITALFSFSFSFIMLCIASLLYLLIMLPCYYQNYKIPWFFLRIFIGILQILLIYSCFRIPRLRKGMIFLYYIPSGNTGSTLCLILIMLIIMFNQIDTTIDSYIFIFLGFVLILAFLLIYWWNYHITQTYRKYLKENEINSLNLLLEEKNQEIAKLTADNDRLARAIHKDNKIIPIIYNSILESHEKRIPLDLSQWEPDSPLGLKLKQLYEERWKILDEPQKENSDLPQTAFELTNATLSFMHSEAKNTGIPFQVMFFDNLESTIPDEITEDDFTHLLSDLLANAMNACVDIASASIQVYLGKTENISTIRICNTGSIFHMETLKNLGLRRHTTHSETGGSGIGLMDIWMLKEKYKATLLIDEVTNGSSSEIYTCINILFNHKNHYIIQSDRHKELSTYVNRPDVMILEKG